MYLENYLQDDARGEIGSGKGPDSALSTHLPAFQRRQGRFILHDGGQQTKGEIRRRGAGNVKENEKGTG